MLLAFGYFSIFLAGILAFFPHLKLSRFVFGYLAAYYFATEYLVHVKLWEPEYMDVISFITILVLVGAVIFYKLRRIKAYLTPLCLAICLGANGFYLVESVWKGNVWMETYPVVMGITGLLMSLEGAFYGLWGVVIRHWKGSNADRRLNPSLLGLYKHIKR